MSGSLSDTNLSSVNRFCEENALGEDVGASKEEALGEEDGNIEENALGEEGGKNVDALGEDNGANDENALGEEVGNKALGDELGKSEEEWMFDKLLE